MDVKIPNIGDIDEVEVIELCVAVGDVVEVDDAILVIESDKASMEIPAPAAGTIESILVAIGDQVGEDHVIATMSGDGGQAVQDSVEAEARVETPVAATSVPTPDVPPLTLDDVAGGESAEVEVIVPDIGDASGVVIIEVAVAAGDVVAVDDLLVVLESDKASMEIAAEHAGTILSVAIAEGQEVEQGTLIATLSTEASAREESDASVPSSEAPAESEQPDETAPAPQTTTPGSSASNAADTDARVLAASKVYAGPAVRRLARELGVALTDVTGTGNRGRIVKDDVKAYVKSRLSGADAAGTGAIGWPTVPTQDYAKFGPIEMVELTRIQQRGADNLHKSWVNLPHVTQHDEADVTDMEDFRKSLKAEAERKGVKLTPLAFIVKACCHALDEYPMFNSSLLDDGKTLAVKGYVNVGMAVDTPEGLVVPVIKEANQKTLWELSADIAELSDKARNKKLGINDLQGGTFSVSSLGGLGGTGFTPIVNAPEVAILGVAKLQTKPQWDGTAFLPRKMLPLSLSYDHRVINGADGGRFMSHLTAVLSDIRRMAL